MTIGMETALLLTPSRHPYWDTCSRQEGVQQDDRTLADGSWLLQNSAPTRSFGSTWNPSRHLRSQHVFANRVAFSERSAEKASQTAAPWERSERQQRRGCAGSQQHLPVQSPALHQERPDTTEESNWQLGGKHCGRLGDSCKMVNIALNTRLCSVLCLCSTTVKSPIKTVQLPIGLLTPPRPNKLFGRREENAVR